MDPSIAVVGMRWQRKRSVLEEDRENGRRILAGT
jgi:hypothetical protein